MWLSEWAQGGHICVRRRTARRTADEAAGARPTDNGETSSVCLLCSTITSILRISCPQQHVLGFKNFLSKLSRMLAESKSRGISPSGDTATVKVFRGRLTDFGGDHIESELIHRLSGDTPKT